MNLQELSIMNNELHLYSTFILGRVRVGRVAGWSLESRKTASALRGHVDLPRKPDIIPVV